MTDARAPWWTAVSAGIEAALVALGLGMLYGLMIAAPLGPAVLPLGLLACALGFLVGGLVAYSLWPSGFIVSGPSGVGTLAIVAVLHELQRVPELRGSLAAGILAIVAAGVLTGLIQILFARLRIGAALKFVPLPVVAGFSNTVALSLIVTMIPAALGQAYQGRLAEAGRWFEAVRPLAVVVALSGTAVGLFVSQRWPRLPAAMIALLFAGLLHHGLTAAGLAPALGEMVPVGHWPALPGPGEIGAVASAGLAFWVPVAKGALVLAVLNSLFSLLNTSAHNRPIDPPANGNEVLRAQGWGNVASGLFGGLPITLFGPATVVLRRRPVPRGPAVACFALAIGAMLSIGQPLLGLVPLAAVAAAVFVASIAILDVWTWRVLRRALTPDAPLRMRAVGELLTGLAVVLVGLTLGLAAALFVGTLAAVCLLALELRQSVVVDTGDLRQHRSRVVRPPEISRRLDGMAASARVVRLARWLYFGTVDTLMRSLEQQAEPPQWLVLDMRQVEGVDATAGRALVVETQRLEGRGTQVLLAGLPAGDARRVVIEGFLPPASGAASIFFDDLDRALEHVENALIGTVGPDRVASVAERLVGAIPDLTPAQADELAPLLERVSIPAGQTLFRKGDEGDALFIVMAGRVSLWAQQRHQPPLRLLSFGPGLMFGEMALLDGQARSLDAVAEEPLEVLRLTRERFESVGRHNAALHAALLRGLSLHLVSRLRDLTRLVEDR